MSAARKYMIIIWAETRWVAMSRKNFPGIYLGEAGNTSNPAWAYALRKGNKVEVRSGKKLRFVFDAENTVVSGFGPDKDGRPLSVLMQEGIVYNYALMPAKSSPVYAGRLLFDRRRKAV